MKSIHDYWDNKIIGWERSAYEKNNKGQSFVEKTAGLFRGIVRERMDLAVKILSPAVKGKILIDIGCGSGILAQRLLQYEPGQITGIDISEKAINTAKLRLTDSRCRFLVQDINDLKLPEGDITIGLGLLDFIPPENLIPFFKNIRSPYFLFSFPERDFSPVYFMLTLYRASQGCPTHNYYTFAQLKQITEKIFPVSNINYVTAKKMRGTGIIHNLLES